MLNLQNIIFPLKGSLKVNACILSRRAEEVGRGSEINDKGKGIIAKE